MTATLNLELLPNRCQRGFAFVQHPDLCDCTALTKETALAAVNTAAPEDFAARIDAAIRSAAALGTPFSANDLRAAFSDAPGPLVGARFNAAAKAGLIEHVGYVPSSKANTHGHDLKLWRGVTS